MSVLGAGSWGIALALSALRAGAYVKLWHRLPQAAEQIKAERENKKRLPGVLLPSSLEITSDIRHACQASVIILATPAQSMREMALLIEPYVQAGTHVIIAAKGIEVGTHLLMSQIIEKIVPQSRCAVISGPSFADEVAQGLPTAITLAAQDLETATALGKMITSDVFRVYTSNDIIGVQLGGALKNVLAIGSGIVRGMSLGANAESALITRGIVEVSRLAYAFGAKPETLHGLSGVGDIILTCSNEKSRNMSLGIQIGRGLSPVEAMQTSDKTFEGFATSKSVCALAAKANVDLPICQVIDQILNHGILARDAVVHLMQRPLKSEVEV